MKNGKKRGIDQDSRNLNDYIDSCENESIRFDIHNLNAEVASVTQTIQQSVEFLKIEHNGDYSLMKLSDDWKEIQDLKTQRKKLFDEIAIKKKMMLENNAKKKKKDEVITFNE